MKSRDPRFSLRTLMLFVAICGAGMAVVTPAATAPLIVLTASLALPIGGIMWVCRSGGHQRAIESSDRVGKVLSRFLLAIAVALLLSVGVLIVRPICW